MTSLALVKAEFVEGAKLRRRRAPGQWIDSCLRTAGREHQSLHGEHLARIEQFWPGQSRRLHDALPGRKTLVEFTAAEGADLHCEVKAPGLRARRMFDWFDTTLTGHG